MHCGEASQLMLLHSIDFQNPGYDLHGLQVLVDKDLQALTRTSTAIACGSQALQVFVNKDLQAHLRLCKCACEPLRRGAMAAARFASAC